MSTDGKSAPCTCTPHIWVGPLIEGGWARITRSSWWWPSTATRPSRPGERQVARSAPGPPRRPGAYRPGGRTSGLGDRGGRRRRARHRDLQLRPVLMTAPPSRSDDAPVTERNVLGGELEPCGTDPLTGFFRDGCCSTGSGGLRKPHHLCGRDRRVPRPPARHRQRPVHPGASPPLPGPGSRATAGASPRQTGCGPTTTAPPPSSSWPRPTNAALEIVPLDALEQLRVDVPPTPEDALSATASLGLTTRCLGWPSMQHTT